MDEIKLYRISRIPSFEYKLAIPSGVSRLLNKRCRADISCHNSWITWEYNDLKEEPNFLENISNFFNFLNFSEYITKYSFEKLDQLNRSEIARIFFDNLRGIFFQCDYIPQYNAELGLYIRTKDDSNTRIVSLTQTKDFWSKQIDGYQYKYQCSGYHNERIEQKLSIADGRGLITLLRLSLLAMINDYSKTRCSNIRIINGWYAYRVDLLDYCKEHGLIWCE